MEIKTKFEADQPVYFLGNGQIINAKISNISVEVNYLGWVTVQYVIQQGTNNTKIALTETELFATPEELMQSLIDKLKGIKEEANKDMGKRSLTEKSEQWENLCFFIKKCTDIGIANFKMHHVKDDSFTIEAGGNVLGINIYK